MGRLVERPFSLAFSGRVRSEACVATCTSPVPESYPVSLSTGPVEACLRTDLPPADDALPGNPGPFDGGDSHSSMAVTTTGICNSERSTGLHSPASALALRPPTDTALDRVPGYRHLA